MSIRKFGVMALAIFSGGNILPMDSVVAANVPTAIVSPSRVRLRAVASVLGSHFRPRATVTLLLAVPDLRTKKVERLLGATHADAHGTVHVRVRMPIVTSCGKATIYLVSSQPPTTASARLQLTGCVVNRGKRSVLPPLPPSPKKP